jgi:membrane-associated protein
LHLTELLETAGYLGIFGIVFAESGLFFGFFLPGDSLLFTAGFLASQGVFSLPVLVVICVTAAITGDAVGYAFGFRFGRRLFERPDSRWFNRKHLVAAEAFYEKHGGKAIVLARFVPIVRTFVPIAAGVAGMKYSRFSMFNVLGGILWGFGLTTAGYVLGNTIPDVDKYLIPVVMGIVIISALPSIIHIVKAYRPALIGALGGRSKREAPPAATVDVDI